MSVYYFLLIKADLKKIADTFLLFEHREVLTDLAINHIYEFIMHDWLPTMKILDDPNR